MPLFPDYKSNTCSLLHKSQKLKKCTFFENKSLHPSKLCTDFPSNLEYKAQSLNGLLTCTLLPYPLSSSSAIIHCAPLHNLPDCLRFRAFALAAPAGMRSLDVCLAPVLACAAIAKYHRLGTFNNRNLFSRVSRNQKNKIKALANLVSSENSLPGLQTTTFLACPHMAFSGGILMTYLTSVTSLEALFSDTATQRDRASTWEFGKDNHSSLTASFLYPCLHITLEKLSLASS